MNQDRFHGICRQLRGTLKERWGLFTGDPLVVEAGMRDRLSGGVQERRGISKQETDRQLEEFRHRHRHWQDLSSR